MARLWFRATARRHVTRKRLTGAGQSGMIADERTLIPTFRPEPLPMNRRLDIDEVNGVTIARFTDKKILDESNIQVIGNQLFSLVDDDHRQKIILDFTNVEYLSSAALGKLITMDKKVKATGGKLRLCSIRSDILEVFKITRLDKLFAISENREKALEGL